MIRKKDLLYRIEELEGQVTCLQDVLNRKALEHKNTVKRHYVHRNSKGIVYHLNKKYVTLAQGRQQLIYYFSRDIRDTATTLPRGYKVRENKVNGFLTVRKPEYE